MGVFLDEDYAIELAEALARGDLAAANCAADLLFSCSDRLTERLAIARARNARRQADDRTQSHA